MTANRNFKRLVRTVAAIDNVPYTKALFMVRLHDETMSHVSGCGVCEAKRAMHAGVMRVSK
jgi:hypothetical protein